MAITYGSNYTFNTSGFSNYVSNCSLSATTFIVSYADTSGFGQCKVGTVSGSTISYGSAYAFKSANINFSKLTAIDSTHFVIVYVDDNGFILAKFGTISGTTISYGAEATLLSSASNVSANSRLDVIVIDSTHFVVVYGISSSRPGNTKYCTISGTTISAGSEYTFTTGTTAYQNAGCILDSTHFVVYSFSGNSSILIGTIASGVISFGSAYNYSSTESNIVKLISIDSTHFIITYTDGNNTGRCLIASVSAGVVSYGSVSTFYTSKPPFISTTLANSTNFIVSFQLTSGFGSAIVGTIASGTASFGTKVDYTSFASTNYDVISMLDTSNFVISYADQRNPYVGVSLIGTATYPSLGPANLKSLNTNLKANIKTINGNPIANVKSYNTIV